MAAPSVASARVPVSTHLELLRRGDRWLITDILIEHVGLVNNHHRQFAAILGRFSYRQLITRMQARIAAPA